MGHCEATLSVGCSTCGGSHIATVYETIVRGRLQWVMTQDCPDGLTEEFGWDETPDGLRRAIIEQCGEYRLRTPIPDAAKKVALMKVLRDRGAALSELPKILEALNGEGVSGTQVELRILEERLQAAGIAASIEADSGAVQ